MTFNPSQARVPAGGHGGGQFGAARNAAAANAQKDKKAQELMTKLLKLPQAQRAAFVKSLSTGDLEKLTRIAYSHATSDPNTVHARMVVAGEMGKRGLDVKKFGALGGGPFKAKGAPKRKAPTTAKKAAPMKTAPAAAPAAATRQTSGGARPI